jgi:hypothetical protein
MTETKHTDKEILLKGLKNLFIALVCFFLGPTLTYISYGIDDTLRKYAALILGILLCILALYFSYRGLKAIMDSMFKK